MNNARRTRALGLLVVHFKRFPRRGCGAIWAFAPPRASRKRSRRAARTRARADAHLLPGRPTFVAMSGWDEGNVFFSDQGQGDPTRPAPEGITPGQARRTFADFFLSLIHI